MASTLNHPCSANTYPRLARFTNKSPLHPHHSFLTLLCLSSPRSPLLIVRAKEKSAGDFNQSKKSKDPIQSPIEEAEEEEEVEEDLPWIQEKALDLVEFTGTVTRSIPGPRVGHSPLPWILAIPLTYVGISLVVAVFKTVRKFTSPRAKRKKLVFIL